jgi:hypothetical protein
VTEQYTIYRQQLAFYGRHLKIVVHFPQAFIENFLNSFFIVVGLT